MLFKMSWGVRSPTERPEYGINNDNDMPFPV